MGGPGSGRRPKPLATLRLTGHYRQDRHGSRELDDAATGKPVCPRWLTGEARKFWDRVVPMLISMGVARSVDQAALVSLCSWWGVWRAKIEQAAEDNDALAGAAKAWTHFASLADRFGMSPAARQKLAITDAHAKKEDPAAKYFG